MITDDDRQKPEELLSLYRAASDVFTVLKKEFRVPDTYVLKLHDIDAAEGHLNKTLDIAAITLRKIQGLRWVAKPGVETTTDVVVALAADLHRALDYLARHCADENIADEVNTFKHQITLAARRAAGKGGIAVLK